MRHTSPSLCAPECSSGGQCWVSSSIALPFIFLKSILFGCECGVGMYAYVCGCGCLCVHLCSFLCEGADHSCHGVWVWWSGHSLCMAVLTSPLYLKQGPFSLCTAASWLWASGVSHLCRLSPGREHAGIADACASSTRCFLGVSGLWDKCFYTLGHLLSTNWPVSTLHPNSCCLPSVSAPQC